MNALTLRPIAAIAALLLATGCTTGTPASGPTPTPEPAVMSTPTPTQTQTPEPTESSPPPVETTPAKPRASVDAVRGEAGGTLTLGGKTIGRDDATGTKFLMKSLGEPDETINGNKCFGDPLKHTLYRWGALEVTVPLAKFPGDEWGAFPKGAVSGWVIDPSLGEPWPDLTLTGPNDIPLGASLKTLKKTFESTGEWDSTGLDTIMGKPTYTIFTGDTIGANFTLDKSNKVIAMSGGWNCRR